MLIRSGQSGEYGVMYSDGLRTISCRKINDECEYLVTNNELLRPWMRHFFVIRVMEKLRLMFKNTHAHSQFLKGESPRGKPMTFYVRFLLFMIIVAPIYFAMMWLVFEITKFLPHLWMELAVEGIFMYGLFMLVASGSMSARSKRYHSAEHQAVNARLSFGKTPTLEQALNASRFHASCGTGAAFSVAVGVFLTLNLFYAFIDKPDFLIYGLLNFLLFPIGVSVGLELFSFIPLIYRKTGIKFIVYPSFLLQRFTTKKATPEEMRVALNALQKFDSMS